LPRPSDPTDYDGTDWTPLAIQVAAARGLKEELGVGSGAPEVNPAQAKPAQVPLLPTGRKPPPVPAANGSGRRG
jgi:hypothetical protein